MKVIIILLISKLLLLAEGFSFQVDNPTSAKAFYSIFNGMSAIFANNTYLIMLNLAFLVGGFFIFVFGVFRLSDGFEETKSLADYPKYIIAATALLTMIYGGGGNELIIESKSNVHYVCPNDNTQAYDSYTVSMPGILPEMFSLINRLGNASTDLASTVFSNISNDDNINKSFAENSKQFYGKETTTGVKILSSNLGNMISNENVLNEEIDSTTFGTSTYASVSKNMDNFYRSCLLVSSDKNVANLVSFALNNTSNIFNTIDNILNNDKVYVYAFNGSIVSSSDILANQSLGNQIIEFNENYGSCSTYWNDYMTKFYSIASTSTYICSGLKTKTISDSDLYAFTGNEAFTNLGFLSELVINSAMINSYNESKSSSNIVNDINYASNKSVGEMAINSVSSGYYMAEMLPYLQSAIRAILISFFPFVFLVIILPGGYDVLKSYALSLLWVELWSPMASVLNMFLSYFNMSRIGSDLSTGGISLFNQVNIINDSTMLSAVAGYLYPFIPALTYMILTSSSVMLNGIFDKLVSAFSSNLESESILSDIEKSKETQNYNNSHVDQMGMDKIARQKILAEAETSAVQSDYTYTNIDNIKNIAKSGNIEFSEQVGIGNSINKQNLSDIETQSAAEQVSKNLTAEQWSGMTQSERDRFSHSESIKEMSDIKERSNFVKALSNDSDSLSEISKNLGDLNSYNKIQKTMESSKYISGYSQMHGYDSSNFGAVASESASSDAAESTMNLVKTKSKIDTYGSDAVNITSNLGKYKASSDMAISESMDIFGFNKTIQGNLNSSLKEYAESMGSVAGYKAGLSKVEEEDNGYANYIGYKEMLSESNRLYEDSLSNKTQNLLNSNGVSLNDQANVSVASLYSSITKLQAKTDMVRKNIIGMKHVSNIEASGIIGGKEAFSNTMKTIVDNAVTAKTDSTLGIGKAASAKIIKNISSMTKTDIMAKAIMSDQIALSKLKGEYTGDLTLKQYAEAGVRLGQVNALSNLEQFGKVVVGSVISAYTAKKLKEEMKKMKIQKNENFLKNTEYKRKEKVYKSRGKMRKSQKIYKQTMREISNIEAEKAKLEKEILIREEKMKKTSSFIKQNKAKLEAGIDSDIYRKKIENKIKTATEDLLKQANWSLNMSKELESLSLKSKELNSSALAYSKEIAKKTSKYVEVVLSNAKEVAEESAVSIADKSAWKNAAMSIGKSAKHIGLKASPAIVASVGVELAYSYATDYDSVAHTSLSLARNELNLGGEAIGVFFGDVLPSLYYSAIGDQEEVAEQLKDMNESYDHINRINKNLANDYFNMTNDTDQAAFTNEETGEMIIVDTKTGAIQGMKNNNGDFVAVGDKTLYDLRNEGWNIDRDLINLKKGH